MSKGKLFIFGLGYTGRELAHQALAHGYSVAGTSRAPERRKELEAEGIEAFDFDEKAAVCARESQAVVSTIAPSDAGDPVIALMDKSFPESAWLGYCSTTGVYGDWQGEWVDETSPSRGNTPRQKRRLKAEEQWLGQGACIFRLSGIYGPGRNALSQLRRGRARRIDKKGQYFSRIHVADIAGVILAAMTKGKSGEIYNVADNEPCASHEVITHAAELLGMQPPPMIPYEKAELSAMAHEFYEANRRVRNEKLKELDYVLLYPTYREGLASLLEAERPENKVAQ